MIKGKLLSWLLTLLSQNACRGRSPHILLLCVRKWKHFREADWFWGDAYSVECSCVCSLFAGRASLLLAFISSPLWGPSVDKPCSTHGVSRPLFASVLNVNRQTGVVRALGRVFSIKDADQANRERDLRETKCWVLKISRDHEKWQQNKQIVFQIKSRSLSESREVKEVDNIKDKVWKSENRCRSSAST